MSSRGPVVTTVMPKPCLKQAAHAQHVQKHAHFPPPSEEARRYSGIEYDRTPIVIAANELALPARGCPGRTFDDLDAHKYRHHLKKLRCPKELLGSQESVAPSSYPSRFGRLTFAADSGALPSLIHADTSESEEDEFRRPSEGEVPSLLLPASGSKRETDLMAAAEPKRLRKLAAHHSRASSSAESRSMHGRKHASTGEKTSNFASCPSSDSCLGGF